jgi:hypothetical protein
MIGQGFSISCTCGQVALEAIGAPILTASCYCESCTSAARRFERVPGAPSVLNGAGGVDYCLFRKDRVRLAHGEEHLESHRLTEGSATRRVVAACCHAPIFLDFTKGHWLTVYRDRLPQSDRPPVEMGLMAKDRSAESHGPSPVPTCSTYSAKFMIKLVAAWIAMRFRKPKLSW